MSWFLMFSYISIFHSDFYLLQTKNSRFICRLISFCLFPQSENVFYLFLMFAVNESQQDKFFVFLSFSLCLSQFYNNLSHFLFLVLLQNRISISFFFISHKFRRLLKYIVCKKLRKECQTNNSCSCLPLKNIWGCPLERWQDFRLFWSDNFRIDSFLALPNEFLTHHHFLILASSCSFSLVPKVHLKLSVIVL